MKHFLPILLSLICITNTAYAVGNFTDVPSAAWYAPYVNQAANENIIEGYSTNPNTTTREFRPQNPVTLAEALKMAIETSTKWNMDEVRERCKTTCLETIGIEHWAKDYLQLAKENQFEVFTENVVLDRPASRRQVAQIVVDAFRIAQFDMSEDPFIDVAMNSKYAGAVHTLTELGITTGDTNTNGVSTGYFRPVDTINRAETVKIMMLAKNSLDLWQVWRNDMQNYQFSHPTSAGVQYLENSENGECTFIQDGNVNTRLYVYLIHPNNLKNNCLPTDAPNGTLFTVTIDDNITLKCSTVFIDGQILTDVKSEQIHNSRCYFKNIGNQKIYGMYEIQQHDESPLSVHDVYEMNSVAHRILESIQ